MSRSPHDLFDPLDPVLFGLLTAAVEEESVLAYEAGFTDGLRAARYRDLSAEDDEGADAAFADALGCTEPVRAPGAGSDTDLHG